MLASLTRYEGWVLSVVVMLIVAYDAWRRSADPIAGRELARAGGSAWRRWRRWWPRVQAAEANAIFYGCLAMSGIAGWVVWNAVIFRAPLYFQTGQFARPSLWVTHSDRAIGHWGVSFMTYLYAVADNTGYAALALGTAGFAYYMVRTRLRAESVAPLALTGFFPFFVYALYSGQRPLHVMQINGVLYNVRFGLLMTLPTAIFFGFLVTAIPRHTRPWLRGAAVAALVLAAAASPVRLDTLTEAVDFRASTAEHANAAAAQWLRRHYDGGKVLMESFGNETVTFSSRIPVGQIIYEGSFRQWQPALAYPAGHGISWIYMRRTPGSQDDVFRRLHDTVLLNSYRLVYEDRARLIYERGVPALLPARSQHSRRHAARHSRRHAASNHVYSLR